MTDAMKPGKFNGGPPPNRLRCSFARVTARAAMNEDEMQAMRRRAWRENGVLVLRPEDIADERARQVLMKAALALYGPRSRPSLKPSWNGQEDR